MIAKLVLDTKQRIPKHRTITESHNGSNNQQRINNNRQQPKPLPLGGLNAFYWYQIFALDSVVVKAQRLLSCHGGFLIIAMYHHRETI